MSRILIIEDDAAVRDNLCELFELKDHTVSVASNGREGLDVCKREKPDLVISDVMMPEMDGIAYLKAHRESPSISNIPVILLTAKTQIEDKIEGLEYGADDYITKPFNTNELLARSNNLIELRKHYKTKAMLEAPTREIKSVDEAFMEIIHDMLKGNLENSNFNIDDVVEELGLSKSTIQRRIKTISGKTFNQLLREFRLEQAKLIILNRGGNISEIAFQVGFNSISYFSYTFKNYFGFTPSDLDKKRLV